MSDKTSDDLRNDGLAALQRQDPDGAEAAFRALLELDPKNIYALVGQGSIARLRDRREDALELFVAAAAAWPRHPWPSLELGGALEAAARLDEAEAAFRRALELSPGYYHALMRLGRLRARRDDHADAAEMFRGAAEANPTDAAAHVALATELARLGRHDEAIAALDAAEEVVADRLSVLKAKAIALRAGGRNEEALGIWRAALGETADGCEFEFEIALELRALGRHLEAAAAYRNVIDNSRATPARRRDAALAGGWLARDQLRDRHMVVDFFERAVALDPEHIHARRELANAYRLTNRPDDAEEVYRELLRREPENVYALSGLATMRRLACRPEQALPLIERACANDPAHEGSRLELGYVLRDLGRANDALATMEAIEPSSAAFAAARAAMGHIARARGDHERSASLFEQAAESAADPSDALYHLVGAKRLLGDLRGARDVVERMLARDPHSFRAHLADGTLKREANDRRAARAAFVLAAEMAPTEAQPRIEIATEDVVFGDLRRAAEALDVALQIDPGHEEARLKKANVLAEGDEAEVEAALEMLAQLRAERPISVWAHLSTAQILARFGRLSAAMDVLKTAQKTCRLNLHIEARIAAVLRQQGLLDESYRQLVAVHERFPREFWSWQGLISAAIELGHFDAAQTLLDAPPPATTIGERAGVAKLSAQFNKSRWALEAAIDGLDAAIELDPNDAGAAEERAKLKLITFDIPGAWADLTAQAKVQSARAKRQKNPLHSLVGQLYEEFALDRVLGAELCALQGLAPQDSLPRLVELVRGYPDSTAPAIGLMIALRRSGQFEPLANGPQRAIPRIPPLVTQYWDDRQPPPDVASLMTSWDGFDPGFRIERFDDASALTYLREHCEPSVALAFSQTAEAAQRADLFRLARLFVGGGYFIDADDRARGGLAAHVPSQAEFFAHQEDLGSIGNNVLGAAPRHPALGLALNDAVAAILHGDRDIVWLTSGPGLLTRSLARWLAAEPSRLAERLAATAILTLAEMRQAVAMHCHAAYKSTGRAWLSGAFRKTQPANQAALAARRRRRQLEAGGVQLR